VKYVKGILVRFNWFAFVGGIATILATTVSFFYPWWQLTGGDDLIMINASPVNMNMAFLDVSFAIPLISALNIIAILSLLASAVAMMVYSLIPRRSYSMQLLGFGYRKPLFVVLFFIISLVAATMLCQVVLNFTIPLTESTTSTLSIPFVSGITFTVLLSAGFQWSFWLAVVATAFCIAARLYHGKIAVAPEE
jgi:hypothetical protein